MILSALHQYYQRVAGSGEGAPPPYGFAEAKVVGALQIDTAGNFHGILDLREVDKNGKPQPRNLAVPLPPHRTVKVTPGFLCDNAGYLCGCDDKGKPARAAEQFAAAAALHRDLLAGVGHPASGAIRAYFNAWDTSAAAERLMPFGEFLAGWLVFRVVDLPGEAAYAHDIPALRQAWERHLQDSASGSLGQCLVTGEPGVPIARLHGVIKGVRDAQSSGASLVSFNIGAATSYGREQSFNAPVGEAAAFGYVTALNHLLRRDGRQFRMIGDTSLVFWTERDTPAETLLGDLFDPPEMPRNGNPDDTAAAQRIGDALDRLAAGQIPDDPAFADRDVRFYLLGLSPNAARLSVRLWQVDSLGTLLDHARDHHRDLALKPEFPGQSAHPPMWRFVGDLRPKDKEGKIRGKNSDDGLKKLSGDLLRAALTGGPYPESLLPLLLDRFRSDRWITHPRVALLKAALNRHNRLTLSPMKELPMSLDENRTELGYRLGRLFAVLENVQRAAIGKDINAGIRDKFIASASATPMTVFPYLLRLSQNHMKKIRRDKPGLAVNLERLTQAIAAEIRDFPAVLSPQDQALFFLGYYQQRQSFFSVHGTEAATPTTAA
ncbi:MAG: type I-C CRISPR-associated protein Cas8c/Csd1 [Rhodospirillaceae bacterium]